MKKLLAVLLILFLWTCEDSKKDPELPIVEDIEFTTIEDTGASFDLLGSDPNDEPFTYSVVTEPIHSGDLFISQPTDPSRSYYSPKQDYHGLDSLTYMATSRHGNSNVGKILITIIPADDDPTSNDIYVTMDEDSGPIDIELSSYEDIDGEGVQFSVLSENDAQYATISGNILTFNPPENFAAIYSLHLEISKATSKSILNRFYVYITVNPVNDPPIAPDMVVHQVDINEPGARIHSDIWNGSDIEYDALTYSIVDGPANGTIIFDNPLDPLDMRYTPNTNFFGIDTFTYSVNDGELETIGNGYIYVNLYNTYTQSTSAVAGKQTSDGGYIVGGGKDWRGGYVIKIDMWGNKEWDYYFIHDQCCGGDYPMINQIISMIKNLYKLDLMRWRGGQLSINAISPGVRHVSYLDSTDYIGLMPAEKYNYTARSLNLNSRKHELINKGELNQILKSIWILHIKGKSKLNIDNLLKDYEKTIESK